MTVIAIKKAIQHFGTISALAKAIGVTPQAVCFWRDGDRRISLDVASKIEKVTDGKVTCEEIRPDFNWDMLRQSPKKAR